MKDFKYLFCQTLVLCGAIVTLIYLLMLGWYSLPTLDDYGFIEEAENGIFSYVFKYYMTWQPRFTTFFVNSLVYVMFGRSVNLVAVTIIMLLLGYGGMFLLLRDAMHINDFKLNIPITILITNLGILAYLEPSTFFWLSALNYTTAIWATLYLVEYLFFSKRPLWLRYCIVIPCSIYISGTAENYTPLVIVVLGLIWCYLSYKNRSWVFWKESNMLILTISLSIIIVGCVAMLLGPGNAVRLQTTYGQSANLLERFSLLNFISTTCKASTIVIGRLLSRLPYYVIVMAVCLWGGKQIRKSGFKYFSPITWKNFTMVLLSLVGFIILSIAMCVFGFGWYPSPRGLCFLSYAIVFTIVYLCFHIGNQILDTHHLIEINLFILLVLGICGISYLFVIDQPRAKLAHDEITERHAYIQKLVEEGNVDPIVIQPVSPINTNLNSYAIMRNAIYKLLGKTRRFDQRRIIYMPYGLSTNPNDFRNNGIKRYYHADFDIIGWEKPNK